MALLTTLPSITTQQKTPAVAPAPITQTKVGNKAVTPVATTAKAATPAATPAGASSVYQPKQIGAVTGKVEGNQLVSNQLTGLLSGNNPYIQLAESKAKQQAAGRGLLNTTMAASAGREAAIGAAMPIAQQDANTYSQQQLANQQAQNQFGLADKQFEQQKHLTSQEFANTSQRDQTLFGYDMSKMDKEFANATQRDKTLYGYDMSKQQQAQGWQSSESALDRKQQQTLLQQEFANATQRDKTLFGYDLSKMDKDFANATARDKTLYGYDLSKMDRDAAIAAARDKTLYGYDLGKQQQAQGWQSSESALDRQQQQALADKEFANTTARDKATQAWQAQQAEADRAWQGEQAKVQAEQQAALTEKRDSFLASLQSQAQKEAAALDIKKMEAEVALRAKETEGTMSQQNRMAYAEAQNRLQGQYLESLQSIYQNPNMNPTQQENAVKVMQAQVQQQMDATAILFGNMDGINLTPGAATGSGSTTTGAAGSATGAGTSGWRQVDLAGRVWQSPTGETKNFTNQAEASRFFSGSGSAQSSQSVSQTTPTGAPNLTPQAPAGSQAAKQTNQQAGWKIVHTLDYRKNNSDVIVQGPNGQTKQMKSDAAKAFLAAQVG